MKFILLCAVGASASISVELSLGKLNFNEEGPATPGPYVFATSGSANLAAAREALELALPPCGGQLLGLLPPASFLLHIPTTAILCLDALRASAYHAAIAPLPARLRSPLLAAPPPPPPRAVRVVTARGSALLADAALPPALAALCAGCALRVSGGATAVVSAAPGAPPLPAPLLLALAAHEDVLWVEAVAPRRALNAFGAGTIATTDYLAWGEVGAEFGVCAPSAGDACGNVGNLPFSELRELYPSLGGARAAPAQVLLRPRPGSGAAPVARRAAAAGGRHWPHLRPAARNASQPPSQQRQSRGRGQRAAGPRRGGRAAAGTCTAACLSPACGLGFGECAGIPSSSSPLAAAGLDGTNQVIHVMDSGLDFASSPYFTDAGATLTPSSTPPTSLGTHRKVAAYWSYTDALDLGGGHGTHVCGSAAGDPRPTTGAGTTSAGDKATLLAGMGMAPGARLYFTDVGCDKPAGQVCTPPPGIPSATCGESCAPSRESLFIPDAVSDWLGPPYTAGARVSSHSWGTDAPPTYAQVAADVDDCACSPPTAPLRAAPLLLTPLFTAPSSSPPCSHRGAPGPARALCRLQLGCARLAEPRGHGKKRPHRGRHAGRAGRAPGKDPGPRGRGAWGRVPPV